MASLTRWTWVWVNSGSWWWTGRPEVLQFIGSQRVEGHKELDTTEQLNWTELMESKNDTDEPICRTRNRVIDVENRSVDMGGVVGRWERWIGRLELTYVHYHMWDSYLVGSCCVAQGAQFSALWWPERRSKRQRISVYIELIYFIVQQKLIQLCKTTIPQ